MQKSKIILILIDICNQTANRRVLHSCRGPAGSHLELEPKGPREERRRGWGGGGSLERERRGEEERREADANRCFSGASARVCSAVSGSGQAPRDAGTSLLAEG